MKKRLIALLALLSLGLIPAFATAVDAVDAPPKGEPGAEQVLLVKAYSTVIAVTPAEAGTTVEFEVQDAYEWFDGSETRVPATALNGQHIVGGVTADTRVLRNGEAVDFGNLKPGMKVKAIMKADAQPVSPTSMFTLLEAYYEVAKPHPGAKFESAFFPRMWHTRGQILGMDRVEDRNVLNVDVRRLEHAPKRFRDEGSRLCRLDAYVIVPGRVVISDVRGRRMAFADLNVDDRIKIVGKFLRPDKWMKDESGEPTPTLLAKRIVVKVHADSH